MEQNYVTVTLCIRFAESESGFGLDSVVANTADPC